LLLVLTLMLWPRRRWVAVMAEPVSWVGCEDRLRVRIPAPDYRRHGHLGLGVGTTAAVYLGLVGVQKTVGVVSPVVLPDQSASRYQQEPSRTHRGGRREVGSAKSANEQQTALAAELETTKAALAEAQSRARKPPPA
jgi:hypothetical protein